MKKKKKRRTALPLSIIFRVILFTAGGALLISYLSIYINPGISVIPVLFGLYFIPLVIINLFLLGVALVKRSSSAWLPFLVLLPVLFIGEHFFRWRESTPGNQGTTLTLLSYNVGMFSQDKKVTRQTQMRNIAGLIGRETPDVVCIQEFFIKDTALLNSFLPAYPYRYYHLFPVKGGSRFGNITLSRFPVVSGGRQTFKSSTNLYLYTDLKVNNKIVRIYNVHLESNNISFTSLIKRLSNSEDKSGEIFDLHDKIALTNKRRAVQVEKLMGSISESPQNSIICGDFNDTPISNTYHLLVKDRKDTFREAGKGFAATYSIFWPLLRIDYIFVPDEFWTSTHRTIKVPYSDHYPVISDIIIP